MGYRSDVVIAVRKEDWAEALLAGTQPEIMCTQAPTGSTDLALYWVIEYVKWYSGFPVINEVDQFLEDLAALPEIELNGYGCDRYAFVRIGEDLDDIEERGSPYEYDIQISRAIHHPFS